MENKKQNCWEYKNCGREEGGENVEKLGVCPAYLETKLNKSNSGVNSGRSCWVVAGTYCGGEVQGTYAKKFENCKDCDFYQKVWDEEGVNYITSLSLLQILKEK